MLRALVHDFIERYDAWLEALLAWHASFRWDPETDGEGPPVAAKPRQVLDITDASRLLSDIGRMVERIETINRGTALTARDVAMLMEKMALVVEAAVPDDTIKERIREGWRGLLAGL